MFEETQKVWRTIAQDHLKKNQRDSIVLGAKYTEI